VAGPTETSGVVGGAGVHGSAVGGARGGAPGTDTAPAPAPTTAADAFRTFARAFVNR
jgi:hypothetical protein